MTIFERIKYDKENQYWLDKCSEIAMLVLEEMYRNNISKKELSIKLGISVKAVSKILSGYSNISIKTIASLEKVLGICLIQIPDDIIKNHEDKIT